MLSKRNKIVSQEEIKFTLKTKFKFFSPYFSLFFKKTDNKNSKYLVSISKKVIKKAVYRNKVRRRLESFILNSNLNTLNSNLNLFFVIKNNHILTLDNITFSNLFFKSLKSLNIKFDMPR